MKDHTTALMLARTLGALVAGVRDKYGHDAAKELFQAAIEKGRTIRRRCLGRCYDDEQVQETPLPK